MSLWFSSLYSLDESFWAQQELSASLGMRAGGSKGPPWGSVRTGFGTALGGHRPALWGLAGAEAVFSMEQPIFLSHPLLLSSLADGYRQRDRQPSVPLSPSCASSCCVTVSVDSLQRWKRKKERQTSLSMWWNEVWRILTPNPDWDGKRLCLTNEMSSVL